MSQTNKVLSVNSPDSSIKRGDKVICIDDSWSCGLLVKGLIYTVSNRAGASNEAPTVVVNGRAFYIDRFKKL